MPHDAVPIEPPATPEEMSLRILVPAFMISELKRAFEIGGLPRESLKQFDDAAAAVGYQKTEDKLMEIKELSARNRPPESLALAIEHAKRGNKEKALYWIAAALPNRPNDAIYLDVEPAFDGLRDDPRFQKLIAQIAFPRRGSPATTATR